MSCHLMCDGDLSELHALAARIGMKRQWFQQDSVVPHYDLTEAKREQAVAIGAVELDRRGAVYWIRLWRWWTRGQAPRVQVDSPSGVGNQAYL